jgi:hypothetical protein
VRLDDVVAAAGPGTELVALDALGAATGERVVVALPMSPVDVPTGRVVDAVVRAGRRVVALAGVSDGGTALVVERTVPAPGLRALVDGTVAEVDGQAALRLDVEAAVEGALGRERRLLERDRSETQRKRAEAAEARVAALTAERAALTARVADLTRELKALRASRAYEVGLAFRQVREAPVSGLVHLPGRLRRAGKAAPDQ